MTVPKNQDAESDSCSEWTDTPDSVSIDLDDDGFHAYMDLTELVPLGVFGQTDFGTDIHQNGPLSMTRSAGRTTLGRMTRVSEVRNGPNRVNLTYLTFTNFRRLTELFQTLQN